MRCRSMTKSNKTMPISVRLPEDLLSDMDAWINEQRIPPGRAKVLEVALREFLDREKKAKR